MYTPAYPNEFDITLDPPFQATGKHFVSVQVAMDVNQGGSKWYWWSANTNAPAGEAIYLRDNGGPWSHQGTLELVNSDIAIRMWGTATPSNAPVIESLTTVNGSNQVALGRRLDILGQTFGAQVGTVLIGGVPAAVSEWTNTTITAYARDATPLGSASVQVITPGGPSNAMSVVVVPREDPDGAGRVLWRFQADDLYIDSDPKVGPDGTIYIADIGGKVYAIEPDGGVKWIYFTYPPYCWQPIDVGPDGTIYTAMLSTVIALNSDGTEKWRIHDPDFDSVDVGPTVGPDGNIYGLSHDHGNGGWGAFSLTPDGELRWNTPGFFTPDDWAPHGYEMIFDNAGHTWTPSIGAGPGFQSFYAFDMESGAITFSDIGAFLQPDTSPSGDRIYGAIYEPPSPPGYPPDLVAFDTNGNIQFVALEQQLGTRINVGPDGHIYVGRHQGPNITNDDIMSFDPDGNERWATDVPGTTIRYDPIVSPANQVVAAPGYWINSPGYVIGLSPQDGSILFNIELPYENNGFVWPFSDLHFALDGQTVYLGTTHNNYLSDPYCYLYAIDAGVEKQLVVNGDVTGDGVVDINDLLTVINTWGVCAESCFADLDNDGSVNVGDLLMVLNNWG